MKHDSRCRRCDEHVFFHVLHIPIAVKERGLFARFLGWHTKLGRFQLRLRRPCGSVEWYGRDLDGVKPSEAVGIRVVGDAPQMATAGGAYR